MTLLPSGFYDNLTPDAEREAASLHTLLGHFAAWGYARVAPPLMEFEETLLAGPGAVLNRATFRIMDTVSHRMLGLRTDHTLQIGRLAATRLSKAPRPLRLSYAGPVVRALAPEQEPARQKMQMGFELIGSMAPEADAEAIRLGLASLSALGIENISVDLVLPTLVTSLLSAAKVPDDARAGIRHALERKDVAELATHTSGELAKQLTALLQASGDVATALTTLRQMQLPDEAVADRTRLEAVLKLLQVEKHEGSFTLDLVENRNFEYQTGLSFSFFSRKGQVELGRGGRYRTASHEPATGLTFYSDALMQVLPAVAAQPHILVPFDLPGVDAAKLRSEGFVLVTALDGKDAQAASAQGCSHIWQNGNATKL